MNPADYVELFRMLTDSITASLMNFLSILFACLAVVVLGGKDFSLAEMVALTTLYFLLLLFSVQNIMRAFNVTENPMALSGQADEKLFLSLYGPEISTMSKMRRVRAGLSIFDWLASIAHMVSARVMARGMS